ncbi:MAG: hypothetical protein AB7L90_01630 [Hyphomicrobiaceae bacterium]
MHSAIGREPELRRRRKTSMQDIKSEYELRADAMGRIGARLAACRKAATRRTGGVDDFAAAAARELADLDPGTLPLAAQTIWTDKVARPLRADPAKPLSETDVAGLRSWPSARLRQLVRALREIERIVKEDEIDARNEIIRATISREYS